MTDDIHTDAETLSAYADGELKAVALARAEKHLAECADCRATLARLRSVVATAGALPREVAPPPELWRGVRGRITGLESRVARRWWHNGWLASAAAVVLVVGTALVVMPFGGDSSAKAAKIAAMRAAAETPVVVASVERHYQPTLLELREAFESQRSALKPSTVQALERSLAVIDTAIAEARAALAADPASPALAEILASYYRRKIEFLKRASTISSL